MNAQPILLSFSSPLASQNRFLPFLLIGNIGVHAAAVHANHRFRQERCRQAHVGGDLAANQLVELDLVGGGHHFA